MALESARTSLRAELDAAFEESVEELKAALAQVGLLRNSCLRCVRN